MPLSEADTHAKLVNPALYKQGWTEEHIKREETTGAVDIIAGKARRRAKGREITQALATFAQFQQKLMGRRGVPTVSMLV